MFYSVTFVHHLSDTQISTSYTVRRLPHPDFPEKLLDAWGMFSSIDGSFIKLVDIKLIRRWEKKQGMHRH